MDSTGGAGHGALATVRAAPSGMKALCNVGLLASRLRPDVQNVPGSELCGGETPQQCPLLLVVACCVGEDETSKLRLRATGFAR